MAAEELPYVQPYAHIVFCEDIRHELNGQATFVGVFRSHILSIPHAQQILLPQLTASVQIVMAKSDPPRSIEVTMEMGEQVIQQVVLAEEQLSAGLNSAHGDDPEATRHFLNIEIKVAPLQILESTSLLVRVLMNDVHLNHSALRFRFQENAPPGL
jgi:hypothetical protein